MICIFFNQTKFSNSKAKTKLYKRICHLIGFMMSMSNLVAYQLIRVKIVLHNPLTRSMATNTSHDLITIEFNSTLPRNLKQIHCSWVE